MQPTLSLSHRTHFFVKDDKLYIKLHKQSRFSDKRDYNVVNHVTVEQAKQLHAWLEQVLDAPREK